MDVYTHGRFQPFHKGHLAFILYLLEKYDTLYIGLGNPLRRLPNNYDTYPDDLKKSLAHARAKENNPFSYLEREQIILESLKQEGIDLARVKILPHFGTYEEENWFELFPPKENTVVAIPAKDEHHFVKLKVYEQFGYKTEIVPQFTTGVSGTKVKDSIYAGTEEWKEMVPKGAIPLIEKWIKNRKIKE